MKNFYADWEVFFMLSGDNTLSGQQLLDMAASLETGKPETNKAEDKECMLHCAKCIREVVVSTRGLDYQYGPEEFAACARPLYYL